MAVSGPGSGTAERLAKEAIFNREVPLIIECTVRDLPGRLLSALRVFHSKPTFCGASVWARRALHSQKRRFPAPRAAACLVHSLLL
jgi:hypothetical protein